MCIHHTYVVRRCGLVSSMTDARVSRVEDLTRKNLKTCVWHVVLVRLEQFTAV
jgi:hypothetical protein